MSNAEAIEISSFLSVSRKIQFKNRILIF